MKLALFMTKIPLFLSTLHESIHLSHLLFIGLVDILKHSEILQKKGICCMVCFSKNILSIDSQVILIETFVIRASGPSVEN